MADEDEDEDEHTEYVLIFDKDGAIVEAVPFPKGMYSRMYGAGEPSPASPSIPDWLRGVESGEYTEATF